MFFDDHRGSSQVPCFQPDCTCKTQKLFNLFLKGIDCDQAYTSMNHSWECFSKNVIQQKVGKHVTCLRKSIRLFPLSVTWNKNGSPSRWIKFWMMIPFHSTYLYIKKFINHLMLTLCSHCPPPSNSWISAFPLTLITGITTRVNIPLL